MKSLLTNKLTWVLALGLALRIWACFNTPIINPDGVNYIDQARAIYNGQWQDVATCQINYLSSLPVFIAGIRTLVPDWVAAARMACLIFGFGMLVPAYLLLRRFFDDTLSSLGTLIFALTPMLVSRSAGVVKGPLYWFFALLGLYLFIRHLDLISKANTKSPSSAAWLLVTACLCFLMAAWARIEALVFLGVSGFFILIDGNPKKINRLLLYGSPLILMGLAGAMAATILDLPLGEYLRAGDILDKLIGPWQHYNELRGHLKQLSDFFDNTQMGRFLPYARNTVWLIALGTLLNQALEAFFYPFFLFFFLGLVMERKKIRSDKRVLYLTLCAGAGVLTLYVHLLDKWVMTYRFMALLLLPCAVFSGFGIQGVADFFKTRFGMTDKRALILITLLFLLSGLPKNLTFRETDKAVYKEIGEVVAQREARHLPVTIAAPDSSVQQWVTFYANLEYDGYICSRFQGPIGPDYPSFVAGVRQNGIKYVLYVRNLWPPHGYDLAKAPYQEDFEVLGRWEHRDTGPIMLLALKD